MSDGYLGGRRMDVAPGNMRHNVATIIIGSSIRSSQGIHVRSNVVMLGRCMSGIWLSASTWVALSTK